MKNIRKFETTAAMDAATLEDVSVNYNTETNKVLTYPLGGGNSIKNYFRFVAVEDSVIKVSNIAGGSVSCDLSYSKNGEEWIKWDFTPIPLTSNETLYMKGYNENGLTNLDNGRAVSFGATFDSQGNNTKGSTGKFECHGNVMSLLYGDEFEDKTTIPSAYCFYPLFYCCEGLLTPPELPATTLAESCYTNMFIGCKSLTTAPELPATTLANGCYNGMFMSCESLTKSPVLPATTLAQECYMSMFSECRSLNEITMLATDISAEDCLRSWTLGTDKNYNDVSGVAETGTFFKHPDMHGLVVGNAQNSFSGIPEGWTVIDYDFKN